MKGLSHFISGVAVATCIPPLVHMASEGSLVMLLAGVGGLMPDTLDFRLARYLEKPDVEIDPHPHAPAPQAVAERVAQAIDRAWETGRPVNVRFHPIRLGVDLWRQYAVHFGGEAQVRVRVGPVVNAFRFPYPNSELDLPAGSARILAPIRSTGDVETKVDVFDGPSFEFRKEGGAVQVSFLPWHRRWSHSLTLTALIGGILALIGGPWYGLAYALGSAAHILADQLGYMGSNLFYPFTRERTEGLRLFHSGDALPNLFAVWLSVVLILFNLDRFSAAPVFNPWSFWSVGLVLPWAVVFGLAWWTRRRKRGSLAMGDARIGEVVAEAEEIG